MALVTPSNNVSEFLLTQNAYSIHEGAASERINLATGQLELLAYTEFHVFSLISPRLLIVLRNSILPIPEEEANPEIKGMRELLHKASLTQHHRPEEAGTLLRDLPVGKARNSYSKVVDGQLVHINGGPKGARDSFAFRFFSIPDEYVARINGIMLEEAHGIDLIVFHDKAAAYKTLEHYLAGHSDYDPEPGRVRALKKLKQAAKLLAAQIPVQEHPDLQQNILRKEGKPKDEVPEDKVHALFTRDDEAKELYTKLSKSSQFDHSA